MRWTDFRGADHCQDVLKGMDSSIPSPKLTREGVFFAGQYFDAFRLVQGLLSAAQSDICVADGYIDETLLDMLSSKPRAVQAAILTYEAKPSFRLAAAAFQQQHGGLSVRCSREFHDRFLFVDDTDFYHVGHSIKDLGKRVFMFSRIEEPEVQQALRLKWKDAWAKATIVI